MQDGSIQIFVEFQNAIQIVKWILEAAEYPLEKIRIDAITGKGKLKNYLKGLPPDIRDSCAVLVNSNAKSVPGAIADVTRRLNNPPVEVFCAIPEIEAWLFADENTARENIKTQWEFELLPVMPLPEDMSTPKIHAEKAFGKKVDSWGFLNTINIDRASARAPSLRHFLTGIDRMLAAQPTPPLRSLSRSISRDTFSGLIREVIPADTIIWRTATGELFTADELRKQIEEGTEVGQQYASDVLRVARDFLKRKANRRES
ncbi:MAG TPA: hypothetical protein DD379_02890 [Cyanobacteria bacterium UBA11162]|nr:hypothetical protein [Cyanobacteria bacterium UBA11162]